jgi:hypothetical protein
MLMWYKQGMQIDYYKDSTLLTCYWLKDIWNENFDYILIKEGIDTMDKLLDWSTLA